MRSKKSSKRYSPKPLLPQQDKSSEPTAGTVPLSSNHSSPPFPDSPALNPVSPQNFSTISSLAGSREIGRPVIEAPSSFGNKTSLKPKPDTVTPYSDSPSTSCGEGDLTSSDVASHGETQTLMQMLSLVGSTFLEADEEGFDQSDEADESQGPSHTSLPKFSKQDRRKGLIMEDCSDDGSTPRNGGTPLSASVLVANSQKSSKTQRKSFPSTSGKRMHNNAPEMTESDGTQEDGARRGKPANRNVSKPAGQVRSSSSRDSLPDVLAGHAPVSLLQPYAEGRSAGTPEDKLGDQDRLIAQLRNTFQLEEMETLVLTQPCWLFRSLLLQGRLYLTTGHLCFYAYLPSRESKPVKTGPLGKKTRRTHRFSQHWASLKGGILSWFNSKKDPYFPQGHIDLRKVSAIESSSNHDERFKIITPERRFTFLTEDKQSRDSWVTALRKETFRAQNEGESVRISLPLEVILDIESTLTVDSTEMVSITVVDEAADFSADEYFFLHLPNQDAFIKATKQLLSGGAALSAPARHDSNVALTKLSIKDSTGPIQVVPASAATLDGVPVLPATHPSKGAEHESVASEKGDDGTSSQSTESVALDRPVDRSSDTYPPPPSGTNPPKSFEQNQKEVERGWAVPGWIKAAPVKVLGRGVAADAITSLLGANGARRKRPRRRIIEDWPKSAKTDDDDISQESDEDAMGQSAHSAFSILSTPDETDFAIGGATYAEQFRQTFGLGNNEQLKGHMHAHLYRVLPIAGRVFVSTGHLAFRSSGIAAKTVGRTLMLASLQDIISASKHQALRPGQHGLVITIRGHEELFLELASMPRRDELLAMIESQAELVREDFMSQDPDLVRERTNAFILRDLSDKIDGGLELSLAGPSLLLDSGLDQTSSISQLGSSIGVPKSPLRFTLLTIGSRGDVQPYIALAKGLQADGHQVKIATHAEFGNWITGHGVEFSEIGGDPAELMRICVDNGTFTVAFLREGMSKFRGWLDDLLESAWRACQGCDVIIECPSAIAGIHVAEALQVPYYRAFTMPWTRTRAYPHAFAVPKAKAGGNYNYMSYVIFDQMFWRASASQINRWRKATLRLQPTSLDKLEQHKVPFIYNFSPSLVPRPLDWFEWIRVTGFWFLDNPENSAGTKWEAPVELTQFIQRARKNNRKLVYIGWGSIVVSDAEAVTRCVLQAVQKSGVCAILSKGWSDRLTAGSGKKNVRNAVDPAVMEDIFQVTSVPHDWLFPQIDAACHHGGAGTLGASLRAGLPTVVKPYFGDQFFWGQQVESLGVGSCVRHLTADNLAKALVAATTNKKQIERAKKLGKQILAEDGIGNAVKAIYLDLEYARSRIKRNTRLPPELVSQTDAEPHEAPRNILQTDTTASKTKLHEDGAIGDDSFASDDWTDVGSRLQDL